MDSRYFFAGDTVRINGNLAQMSEWADGVPMEQDISDSSVWTITLNLPFAMSDNWPAGLFEFRYEIVSGSDGAVITEGQFDRTEPKLRSHFYHTFRPNYRVARFRNAAYLQGKAAFLSFLNVELSQHKDGLSSAREFMGRYRDLAECLTGTMRIHVEELLESEIAKAERQVGIGTTSATLRTVHPKQSTSCAYLMTHDINGSLYLYFYAIGSVGG
jgi:hypothetical protein